jgi:hypothetical protein
MDADGGMVVKEVNDAKLNDVTYMSDELGLHRVENPSHSSTAVSLHLYSPPFKSCQVREIRIWSSSLSTLFTLVFVRSSTSARARSPPRP